MSVVFCCCQPDGGKETGETGETKAGLRLIGRLSSIYIESEIASFCIRSDRLDMSETVFAASLFAFNLENYGGETWGHQARRIGGEEIREEDRRKIHPRENGQKKVVNHSPVEAGRARRH